MKWILHIGAPKTGSTAIQRALFENQDKLLAHDFLYPNVSLRGYGHHDLAFLLGGGYPDWATSQARTLEDLRGDLLAALRRHPVGTVIISSENFYLYPKPKELRDLLLSVGMAPDDPVSVICYVRRQDAAHVSWYNQTVKAQGSVLSFAECVRQHRSLWDYEQGLRPWQETFGTAALSIRDYSSFGAGAGDILEDFFCAIGLPLTDFKVPADRINERINRDLLTFQRSINRLPLSITQKRRYHKQLIALSSASSGKGIFDDRPFLTRAEAVDLLQCYAASNRAVAETYLGRSDLFAPAIPESDDAISGTGGLTLSKILLILKWLFIGRQAGASSP